MSSSPTSTRLVTPPTSAPTRSGRARKPVQHFGSMMDSDQISDDEAGEEIEEDDGESFEVVKGKKGHVEEEAEKEDEGSEGADEDDDEDDKTKKSKKRSRTKKEDNQKDGKAKKAKSTKPGVAEKKVKAKITTPASSKTTAKKGVEVKTPYKVKPIAIGQKCQKVDVKKVVKPKDESEDEEEDQEDDKEDADVAGSVELGSEDKGDEDHKAVDVKPKAQLERLAADPDDEASGSENDEAQTQAPKTKVKSSPKAVAKKPPVKSVARATKTVPVVPEDGIDEEEEGEGEEANEEEEAREEAGKGGRNGKQEVSDAETDTSEPPKKKAKSAPTTKRPAAKPVKGPKTAAVSSKFSTTAPKAKSSPTTITRETKPITIGSSAKKSFAPLASSSKGSTVKGKSGFKGLVPNRPAAAATSAKGKPAKTAVKPVVVGKAAAKKGAKKVENEEDGEEETEAEKKEAEDVEMEDDY